MKREDVIALPSMPAASPSYPRGPYRFVDREYLIITYETDAEALRDALPEPLKPDGSDTALFEFIRMPDLPDSATTIPTARRGTLNGLTRSARSGALRHCKGSNTLMFNTAAHGRRVGAGWKNTPAVIVPEKEDREHARRLRSLDAHVASAIRIQAAEPCDVRWRSRGRSEPFVN